MYRRPSEIIHDIYQIKGKLEDMEQMLNIRSLLSVMMTEQVEPEPEQWVARLKEAISEAEDTLEKLRELKASLDMLETELEDTLWVLGA